MNRNAVEKKSRPYESSVTCVKLFSDFYFRVFKSSADKKRLRKIFL